MEVLGGRKEDKVAEISISLGGFLFLQVVLLLAYYGFDVNMPWWALWLPFLVLGGIILFCLVMLLIILIIMAVNY